MTECLLGWNIKHAIFIFLKIRKFVELFDFQKYKRYNILRKFSFYMVDKVIYLVIFSL